MNAAVMTPNRSGVKTARWNLCDSARRRFSYERLWTSIRDYYDERDTSDTADRDERHRDDDDDALTLGRGHSSARVEDHHEQSDRDEDRHERRDGADPPTMMMPAGRGITTMLAGRTVIARGAAAPTRATCSRAGSICPADAPANWLGTRATANT
jgi:hypothetical protein